MARSMTVAQAVNLTILLATGKGTILLNTDPKYLKIVALLDNYQQEWADEPDVDWSSLRQTFNLGTISATDTYQLDDEIGEISSQEGDYVRITSPDNTQQWLYTIVPAQRLYDLGQTINNNPGPTRGVDGSCSTVGSSLVFSRPFLPTDPQIGGTLTVAGYILPDTLANPNDIIQVDNPRWLCYRTAAEYVRTDITRQDQYPNLIAQATAAMESMKDLNETQSDTVLRNWNPMLPASDDAWS